MVRASIIAVAALLACDGWPALSRADVCVRVPFVSVQIGGPSGSVNIRAPFVSVLVPGVALPRVMIHASPPSTPIIVVGRPQTIAEFAVRFKPAPGTHNEIVLHPVTQTPVRVQFILPEGLPKAVRALPRQVVFNYGRHAVRLRFTADGGVKIISR